MDGSIITVVQQKGGVGKTMLTAHLSVCAALGHGKSVAILDVDPQGSLGEWLEKREALLGEDATGLTFRTSSGWGSRREAQSLARDHDYVFIDTPPHAELEAKQTFRSATLALIPVQPAHIDLWATQPTLDMATGQDTPSVFVLNRVPARARITQEIVDALDKLGGTVAKSRIGNRVAFAESIGQGRTAIETHASSIAAAEVRALTKEILGLASR